MFKMIKTAPTSTSESQITKKPTSEKKIAANKLNGNKSHGPKNTSITKYNAIKHGLLVSGVTELDNAEGYQTLLEQMVEEKNPVGPIEKFLVETAVHDMVRVRRARRLEAEYIRSVLYPPKYEGAMLTEKELYKGTIVSPGLPAVLDPKQTQPLVSTYQRYESNCFTTFLRALHELERGQRLRLGEAVPAPSALDVNLLIDTSKDQAQAESPIIGQAFPDPKNDGMQ
jgi:hypothetical protein